MAPRAKTSPTKRYMRKPGTGPLGLTPVVEEPSSGVRRSLRLQNKPPASHAAHSRPSNQVDCTNPAHLQCKRIRDRHTPGKGQQRCTYSSLRPPKKLQKNSQVEPREPSLSEEDLRSYSRKPPLSEEDLRSLYNEVMAKSKRTSLSIAETEGTEGTETRRSCRTSISNYRYENLKSFNILIHAKPPNEITTAVNKIVSAEVSEDRLAVLSKIAESLSLECHKRVVLRSGEDDFLGSLMTAIKSLGFEHSHYSHKTRWRVVLDPVNENPLNHGYKTSVQQPEVDDDLARPQKHQRQPATEYMSNTTSPRALPPRGRGEGCYTLKTPFPDVSIGIHIYSLTEAFSSRFGSNDKAERFIDFLENRVASEGQAELVFVPGKSSGVAFPFAVIESKSYSSGHLYDAENQTAVAGACALKI
ncbi:hypothetical protein GP486_006806 [Trichoglossum hirsutum]|uniref:Uncharacterized protein n=1 Tax=Trichoglossum hirsutum TaxID=265104 RepID=A0A9P8II94_9PEZI|nr:hypothetical protein GP486_006806 [Trichoglossum hirsutum]